ncbi:MAG: Uma2 family endonuclease [Cyclobacteriaceae bacterium]|jgi:Uma2 family endonuclease|nr:Uma2 family endonuclease [Flammeovirgaceae bacterium]
MEIIVGQPPRTIMEVYEMLPEGTLAELIDNQIYMSPSPSFFHQDLLFEISLTIRKHLKSSKLGTLVVAPFDVWLDQSKNAVQPDIVVILEQNPAKIDKAGRFVGIPDLLIEILSPNNKEHDLHKKKDLYEKFGVQEYWIVDPETNIALGFALKDKRYIKISEEIGKISSELLKANFNF